MRLLQEAVKTYDAYRDIVGVYEENKSPLVPISHALKKLDIVVTVDEDGEFLTAQDVSKDNFRAIIPVTKESGVRTANVAPHPLCDGISYLGRYDKKGNGDYRKNNAYKELLRSWAESPFSKPVITAVSKYIDKDELLKDLEGAGLIELDERGCPKKDVVIGWTLMTKDEEYRCWDDKELMMLWQHYVLSTFSESDKITCMLTGEPDYYWNIHAKGVVPGCDTNAKLISQDYTDNRFKSRFLCAENKDGHEDLLLGYISSQKAHNALKWMLSNYAVTKKSVGMHRDILCWSPTHVEMISPLDSIIKRSDLKSSEEDEETEVTDDIVSYKKLLKDTLLGYIKDDDKPLDDDAEVIVASFDGMTPGRVAVTYYNEMTVSDYFWKILKWDEECCYYHNKYGIVSPPIQSFVRYAFGRPTTNKSGQPVMDIGSDTLTRLTQTLLSSKLEGKIFPEGLKNTLVSRVSKPAAYDHKLWNKMVQLAVSAIRKSRLDRGLEDYGMKLDTERMDRDYLVGRLMAILEKVENDIYKDKDYERTTNIERLWGSIEISPMMHLKRVISKQKTAYYPKLKPGVRVYYEKMIEEIFAKLMEFPENTINNPLKETYLLGYYAQKNALYEKRIKDTDGTDPESEDTDETANEQ